MFAWIKRRRDTQSVIATLTAENERLRSDNRRLSDAIAGIASAANRIAKGERVYVDTWAVKGSYYTPKEFDPACGTGGFMKGGAT
jgi:hypothetical protein